jgi:TatD DNase family protein
MIEAEGGLEFAGAPAFIVYPDSHAHLEMVAARLGEDAVLDLLCAYAHAAAEPARGPLPFLVDIGVEAADLARRAAFVSRLLLRSRVKSRQLSSSEPLVMVLNPIRPVVLSPDSVVSDAPEPGRMSLPPWLALTAGIWPGRPALDDPEGSMTRLEASVVASSAEGLPVAAIGECGLDFHHMEADGATQARLFALQCDLARRLGLPLVVHSRDAFAPTLEVLRAEAEGIPVIIHCFGYGPAEARAFLDSGYRISFAGNLTYPKAAPLREALVLVPENRLLLETDAPYMNPHPGRGRPSSSFDIGRSYEKAAALRGVDPGRLAAAVSRNLGELLAAVAR